MTPVFRQPRFTLCHRTVVCLSVCLSCLSVCLSVGRSVGLVMLVYSGQTVGWIKVPLGTEIGLGPGHIVLDGDPTPSTEMGTAAPYFSAHIYCGQTAGWTKMPLGTEVSLGPSYIVLDGNPASPTEMGTAHPLLGPSLLWPNGRPSQPLLSSCKILLS